MEQKRVSSFIAALMPGIYLGVALIIFRLILFLLDVGNESWLNYTAFILVFAGLFLGVVNFRDKYRDGILSYGEAVGHGFAIGLYSSIIASVFTYFYVIYIDPGMIEQVMLQAENNMLEQNPNMSDEQLEQALSMVEVFSSPMMMAVIGFISNLLFSLVFSLIIAIFAKREDRSIA